MSAEVLRYPPEKFQKIWDETLLAPLQTAIVSGIPQDADRLHIEMRAPFSGSGFYRIRPNGLATNISNMWENQDWAGGPTQTTNDTTGFLIATGDGNARDYRCQLWIDIPTGVPREFYAHGTLWDGVNNRIGRRIRSYGYYNDPASPLVFCGIASTNTGGTAHDGFPVGSRIMAWVERF